MPVFQFYCGVCLLMVQVIRIIRALQEGQACFLAKPCKVGCIQ